MNPNSPAPAGASPIKPLPNREFAAQNLGNSLSSANPTAATILAENGGAASNIYFVSRPDESAQMSLIAPAATAEQIANSPLPTNFSDNNSNPPANNMTNNIAPPAAANPGEISPFPNSAADFAAPTPTNASADFPAPGANSATSAEQYLDEISASSQSHHKFLSGKMLLLGGAVLALIATLIIIAATGNVRQAPAQGALALGTELTNLQTLITYGQSNNLSTPNTTKVVAEASLVVQSRKNDLTKVFTLTDDKKKDSSAATPSFVADLNAAKSQGNLEKVYADTLKDQLNATYLALQALNKQSTSADGQSAIAKSASDIEELYRRMGE